MYRLLLATWQWEPTVLAGCTALLVGYRLAVAVLEPRFWLFLSGVLVLLFALVSPLDTLGDRYLLSAHMLQHILLIVIVPPLLLLGLPPSLLARIVARPLVGAVERILGRPLVAWLSGMVTMWLWHLPVLYDAALMNESIHILQHLSFLVTSVIFWWPVVTPLRSRRLAPPAAGLYLFAAFIATSMLGVIITFAPAGLYTPYVAPIDTLDLEPLIRAQWGLTPAVDQQAGGLLMWVAGGIPYFATTWILVVRWYLEEGGEPAEPAAMPPSAAPE